MATTLSLKINDLEVTATSEYNDLGAAEILDLFWGIMITHTYTEQTLINMCKEKVEEYE